MSYDSTILADSPWGYWKLDEPSGTAFADSSGNGRGGTWSGSPTLAQAGIVLDGGYSVNPPTAADFGTVGTVFNQAQASIEVWMVYGGSDGWQFGCDDGLGSVDKIVNISGGKAEFYLYDGSARHCIGSTSLVNGSIYHLVGTCDGSNARIYVNGAQDGILPAGNSFAGYAAPNLKIGHASSPFIFVTGRRDNCAAYVGALSAARVLAHYQAGITVFAAAAQALQQLAPLNVTLTFM